MGGLSSHTRAEWGKKREREKREEREREKKEERERKEKEAEEDIKVLDSKANSR